MISRNQIFSNNERSTLLNALQVIRKGVQWKTGKDVVHLKKRQRLSHIPPSASLLDYDTIIFDLVKNDENILYLYEFIGNHYYAVRGFVQETEWLVIFGAGGVMETAFPPEKMGDYLQNRGFVLIGQIKEVLKWT